MNNSAAGRLLSIIMISVFIFSGCKKTDHLPFIERIQPVPRNSGFKMEGYWVWGGSLIRVDSVYHLFCSRWPKSEQFPGGYLNHSEIVRATSSSALGPFEFQETVIGERDSIYWDANMAHNPTIHKVNDTFILFYIGTDFKQQEGWPPVHRSVGYATSDDIEGPWNRCDKPVIPQESNNPAVFFEKDGSVKLVFRDAPLQVYIATAANYKGPYVIENNNVWPDCKLEDFYMFRHKGKYHIICEDNVGGVSGHERWGVQLVSDDGIHNWEKFDPVIAYDHDITFDDGTVLHCNRRERPQLLIEEGKVTHLITAIYDGESSWCQPARLDPAY